MEEEAEGEAEGEEVVFWATRRSPCVHKSSPAISLHSHFPTIYIHLSIDLFSSSSSFQSHNAIKLIESPPSWRRFNLVPSHWPVGRHFLSPLFSFFFVSVTLDHRRVDYPITQSIKANYISQPSQLFNYQYIIFSFSVAVRLTRCVWLLLRWDLGPRIAPGVRLLFWHGRAVGGGAGRARAVVCQFPIRLGVSG